MTLLFLDLSLSLPLSLQLSILLIFIELSRMVRVARAAYNTLHAGSVCYAASQPALFKRVLIWEFSVRVLETVDCIYTRPF